MSAVAAVEYIHEGVGLTRRVLCDENGRAFRLDLDFHNWRGTFARLGEIYQARVIAKEAGGAGVFAELGVGAPGLLRSRAAPPEGALCAVRVAAEARAEKGPALSLVSLPKEAKRPDGPGLIQPAVEDPFLTGVEIMDRIEGADARLIADQAQDAAAAPVWPLANGGSIAVEATRAFVAIDVDAGGRTTRGDREALALAANFEAVAAIARALALKSLGGLVVVDLLKLSSPESRRRIETAFDEALRRYTARKCEIGRISRFGLLEASLQWGARPVAQALSSVDAAAAAALAALNEIVRVGEEDRGARIEARIGAEVDAWLKSASFDWREQVEKRIGARFSMQTEPGRATGDETIRSV